MTMITDWLTERRTFGPETEGTGGESTGGDSTAGEGTVLDADTTTPPEAEPATPESAAPEADATKAKTVLDDDQETPKDGEKPDEEETPDPGAEIPEDGVYEFELPEGVELSDEDKTAWSSQFKELGLTRAQANALVTAQAERVAAENEAYEKFLSDQQNEHIAAAKADPEIGGDKWDQSVALAKQGLKLLGGSAIKDLILTSGNGNNPEVIRELSRIGRSVADDTFERGASHEAAAVATETNWYGSTTPNTKKG